jgi:hypothetical protein
MARDQGHLALQRQRGPVDVSSYRPDSVHALPYERMLDTMTSQTISHSARLAPRMIAALFVMSCIASATAQSATTPRVRGTPVLTFDRKHPKDGLTAYVRFDREVPRRASGAPLLRISIPSSDPTFQPAVTVGRRGRACYTATLADSPARPRTGMRIRLHIDVGPWKSYKRYRFTVRVRGLNGIPVHQTDNPLLQELGCVNGR